MCACVFFLSFFFFLGLPGGALLICSATLAEYTAIYIRIPKGSRGKRRDNARAHARKTPVCAQQRFFNLFRRVRDGSEIFSSQKRSQN